MTKTDAVRPPLPAEYASDGERDRLALCGKYACRALGLPYGVSPREVEEAIDAQCYKPAASPDATPAATDDSPCAPCRLVVCDADEDFCDCECHRMTPAEKTQVADAAAKILAQLATPAPKPDAPGGPSDCPYCGGHGFTMNGSEQVTCPVCKGSTYVAPPPSPQETTRDMWPELTAEQRADLRAKAERVAKSFAPVLSIRAEVLLRLLARDAELAKVNAALRAAHEGLARENAARDAAESRADAAEARATEAERYNVELQERLDNLRAEVGRFIGLRDAAESQLAAERRRVEEARKLTVGHTCTENLRRPCVLCRIDSALSTPAGEARREVAGE